ncbi:hypothetical protein AMECASPLE_021366 [Ameca splendens]|uniref:Uncharacterized protein n=1 Tax=Ameca splendens TaxID=208324 RepID=A0ABV1A0P0_9TELE
MFPADPNYALGPSNNRSGPDPMTQECDPLIQWGNPQHETAELGGNIQSPTIYSRFLSTSRASSGSFTPSEVTFYFPRASQSIQRLGQQGPTFIHCTILSAPVPHGSPYRWWAHWGMASRLLFGLGPARSHEEQPGHQPLSNESQLRAWLQGGTPAPPYQATSRTSNVWSS